MTRAMRVPSSTSTTSRCALPRPSRRCDAAIATAAGVSAAVLEAANEATDAEDFYKKYYVPANMVVAIVGDVRPAEAVKVRAVRRKSTASPRHFGGMGIRGGARGLRAH